MHDEGVADLVGFNTPRLLRRAYSDIVHFESHNSVGRADSFMWHDFRAHRQCGGVHLYLPRGHLDWNAKSLGSLVNSAHFSSLFNTRTNNEQESANEKLLQSVNPTRHDYRYMEKLDGSQYANFRPIRFHGAQ